VHAADRDENSIAEVPYERSMRKFLQQAALRTLKRVMASLSV
jgi:hypothetical protein